MSLINFSKILQRYADAETRNGKKVDKAMLIRHIKIALFPACMTLQCFYCIVVFTKHHIFRSLSAFCHFIGIHVLAIR